MTLNEFQELAMRTYNKNQSGKDTLVNAALGLAGESGEVCDHIKKHVSHGHELDKTKLLLEIGDVFWYICQMAKSLDTDLETVAKMNVAKLEKRYPNGFNSQDSINRNG